MNGLYLSAMGAKVQDARMDVIANNLANVQTTGYRRDQAVFRQRLAASLEDPRFSGAGRTRDEAIGGGVFLAKVASLDEPGPLDRTERPLDLAIDGQGFLQVRSRDGGLFYTRAGNLRLDEEGTLVTADGRYRVQGQGGGDINLPQGHVEIGEDGAIFVDGQPQAQLGLLLPSDMRLLSKRGDNVWGKDGPVGDLPSSAKIRQGFLEGSTVEPMHEMTEMIEVQRTYEMNMKAMQIQDAILARAVGDVGRATAS